MSPDESAASAVLYRFYEATGHSESLSRPTLTAHKQHGIQAKMFKDRGHSPVTAVQFNGRFSDQ